MQDSLVSINILEKNTNILLNKNSIPLLYYWNGENNVLDELKNDEKFLEYCASLFTTPEKYLNIFVGLFYFKYNENDEEEYSEVVKDIQDILYLDKFDSYYIINHFLLSHFLELYKTAFKEEYEYSKLDDNLNDIIIDIYNKLKDKFTKRISKTTVINWVRSVLLDKNHFNTINTNYIIKILEQKLENNE